jgi:hypothetical protein
MPAAMVMILRIRAALAPACLSFSSSCSQGTAFVLIAWERCTRPAAASGRTPRAPPCLQDRTRKQPHSGAGGAYYSDAIVGRDHCRRGKDGQIQISG